MLIFTQCARDAEAPAVPKLPKIRRRRSCFVALISFLLSILLLAALVLAIPVTFLRFLLTDHNIEVIVNHVIDTVDIAEIEIATEDGTKTMSEVVHGFTSGIEGLNMITEEQISETLLNDFVKEFITDTLRQYGLSLKEGAEILGWTPEQIYSFIEANKDTIVRLAREAGYEGEIKIEDNREIIISSIESATGKDGISTENFLKTSEETEQLQKYLDSAQLIFSDSALYLVWGLVAFTGLLLFFLNIGFLGSFCRAGGFPAFIAGGIYTLAAFAVEPVLAMIKIENAILAEILNFTVGFAVALLADIALPAAVIGLGLIIVSFIFDAFRKK